MIEDEIRTLSSIVKNQLDKQVLDENFGRMLWSYKKHGTSISIFEKGVEICDFINSHRFDFKEIDQIASQLNISQFSYASRDNNIEGFISLSVRANGVWSKFGIPLSIYAPFLRSLAKITGATVERLAAQDTHFS